MIHFNIEEISGKTINEGIHERVIKILASKSSTIKRDGFTVGVSIINTCKVHEDHKHEEFEELIVVLEGEGIARISGEEFKIIPGSVIEVKKNEFHGFVNSGCKDLKLLWIYNPPGEENKFLDR